MVGTGRRRPGAGALRWLPPRLKRRASVAVSTMSLMRGSGGGRGAPPPRLCNLVARPRWMATGRLSIARAGPPLRVRLGPLGLTGRSFFSALIFLLGGSFLQRFGSRCGKHADSISTLP